MEQNIYGLHAFHATAPKEWNRLPLCLCSLNSLPSSAKRFKTYYFSLALRHLDFDFASSPGDWLSLSLCASDSHFGVTVHALQIYLIMTIIVLCLYELISRWSYSQQGFKCTQKSPPCRDFAIFMRVVVVGSLPSRCDLQSTETWAANKGKYCVNFVFLYHILHRLNHILHRF